MLFEHGQLISWSQEPRLLPRLSSLFSLSVTRKILVLQTSEVHEIGFFLFQQMSERTLVPIFVFWAFLTIITPTLVLLSENSKLDYDLHGKHLQEIAISLLAAFLSSRPVIFFLSFSYPNLQETQLKEWRIEEWWWVTRRITSQKRQNIWRKRHHPCRW